MMCGVSQCFFLLLFFFAKCFQIIKSQAFNDTKYCRLNFSLLTDSGKTDTVFSYFFFFFGVLGEEIVL